MLKPQTPKFLGEVIVISIGVTLVQVLDFVANEIKRSSEEIQTPSLIGRILTSIVDEST